MTMHHPGLAELVRRDPRYTYEAYEFLFESLAFTQQRLNRIPQESEVGPQHHVSGPELLDGIRELALREFGLMARTVFRMWGINKTDDFGEMVFNLVESNLMSKTDEDKLSDFRDVYNLDQVLVHDFHIQLSEDG
jgi:uncharacterized repeat protein (TIGR04138 family)